MQNFTSDLRQRVILNILTALVLLHIPLQGYATSCAEELEANATAEAYVSTQPRSVPSMARLFGTPLAGAGLLLAASFIYPATLPGFDSAALDNRSAVAAVAPATIAKDQAKNEGPKPGVVAPLNAEDVLARTRQLVEDSEQLMSEVRDIQASIDLALRPAGDDEAPLESDPAEANTPADSESEERKTEPDFSNPNTRPLAKPNTIQKPEIKAEWLKDREELIATFDLEIDRDGNVTKVTVINSKELGPEIEGAVTEAVKKWKFINPTRKTVVAPRVNYPITAEP